MVSARMVILNSILLRLGYFTPLSLVPHTIPRPPMVARTLLQDGVARRVGEQTEALWSLTKPFQKRARYMTPAHWQDNTNPLLWQLTLRKQKRFPRMLRRKLVRIETKIVELILKIVLVCFYDDILSIFHHKLKVVASDELRILLFNSNLNVSEECKKVLTLRP